MSMFHKKSSKAKLVMSTMDTIQTSKYKSNIIKLYFFNFFIGFSLISGILIPFYLIYGGFTFFEFMLLQSYYAFIVIIFEIPCGIIADRFSKKFTLMLAGLSYLFVPLAYGIISNKILFLIGETLFAFSNALISGTNEAIVYENLKQAGKESLIMKTVAKNDGMFLLGVIISAPLGSILANLISIRIVVLLMIIPYFISLIITFTIQKISRSDDIKKKSIQILKSGFKELRKNKILKILVFEKITIEIIIVFLVYTYQYYILLEFSIPIFYFGFIDAGLTLSQFTFLNLIPHLTNNSIDKKKLLLINTIIPGIGYILIAIVNFAPAIIFLFLIVIGLGLSRYIIFINGINRQIKENNRTTILSTINVISGILKAILYPLIGILIMFNINFLYLIFGILILFFALKSKIKKEYL
ncbi:MAG: MFS transporter [Candidatus Lokiarchaeota archaeon]|nr:MFS transporter [Candidatus Lokiarchaeota archaeon]